LRSTIISQRRLIICQREEDLGADDHTLGFVERRRLVFLAAALRHDPDTGWRVWVEHEGDRAWRASRRLLRTGWMKMYRLGGGLTRLTAAGQAGRSPGIFSDLDGKVLDALGVVILRRASRQQFTTRLNSRH
jgi:hypothetical protein